MRVTPPSSSSATLTSLRRGHTRLDTDFAEFATCWLEPLVPNSVIFTARRLWRNNASPRWLNSIPAGISGLGHPLHQAQNKNGFLPLRVTTEIPDFGHVRWKVTNGSPWSGTISKLGRCCYHRAHWAARPSSETANRASTFGDVWPFMCRTSYPLKPAANEARSAIEDSGHSSQVRQLGLQGIGPHHATHGMPVVEYAMTCASLSQKCSSPPEQSGAPQSRVRRPHGLL